MFVKYSCHVAWFQSNIMKSKHGTSMALWLRVMTLDQLSFSQQWGIVIPSSHVKQLLSAWWNNVIKNNLIYVKREGNQSIKKKVQTAPKTHHSVNMHSHIVDTTFNVLCFGVTAIHMSCSSSIVLHMYYFSSFLLETQRPGDHLLAVWKRSLTPPT